MKKVLIALDYDPAAQKIAETGYALAKSMNAKVILLHVISDPAYYSSLNYSPIFGYDSFSNLDIVQTTAVEELKKAAKNYLDKSKQHLGDETIETVIKDGDFGESILDTAKEMNVDIIVMGSHGRRGFDKILMGSVAEKVLHKTTIPLFVIPTKNVEEN
ncbi:MAG TPA: universal stress protein [Ginsengibacter sp.]|jgi:nucleotide-binding universal stress UspA family protein